jgi:hypothetical protein
MIEAPREPSAASTSTGPGASAEEAIFFRSAAGTPSVARRASIAARTAAERFFVSSIRTPAVCTTVATFFPAARAAARAESSELAAAAGRVQVRGMARREGEQ